jgi:8-oxo-dGTP diphosphatase
LVFVRFDRPPRHQPVRRRQQPRDPPTNLPGRPGHSNHVASMPGKSVVPRRYRPRVHRDELQRRSVNAALEDVRIARVEFDDTAAWLATVGDHPADPLGADVWVFNKDLTRVLLVHHPWRGWVPPGGRVEPGETPREAAARELFEETGVRAELLTVPAGANVRSYHPDHGPSLSLSYAAIVDHAVPLVPEPGQPAAWTDLATDWQGYFPDDPPRIRQHAQWLASADQRPAAPPHS